LPRFECSASPARKQGGIGISSGIDIFHPPITRPGSDARTDEKEIIMAECSVCGKPAASQITTTENGQRRQLMLCDEHYMEFMARNQRRLSPLESLFHGVLFDSRFDDM
jgi:ATP-dependent Clp protease ATP-binding subunit ClpC